EEGPSRARQHVFPDGTLRLKRDPRRRGFQGKRVRRYLGPRPGVQLRARTFRIRMKIFLLFLTFLILQRLSELMLAKRNERTVRSEGAVEYDAGGYRVIVLMHTAFLVSFA